MRAAFHLKPVLLELGGKNFAIVLDDADLDEASEDILTGAFLNVRPPPVPDLFEQGRCPRLTLSHRMAKSAWPPTWF